MTPKIRRVTFANPPVNVVGADTVAQLSDMVEELSQTRVPLIGKLIAEHGLDEVELNLGRYAGIANQQA